MTTDNTIKPKYINMLIKSQLEKGITDSLADQLRVGNAHLIDQTTWLMVADWLENGCKRPKKRPPKKSHEIFMRNSEMRLLHDRLRNDGLSQSEIYAEVSKQFGTTDGTTRRVLTHPND